MTNRFYRQSIPELGISIERATESTPDDSKFYVFLGGETIGSYRSLKKAQEVFKEAIRESGFQPSATKTGRTPSEMMTERYMESKDLYWANSYRYRGGGGRGGRGGI